eukprot:scaffold114908_cov57-Phaeocystis_antarctica.AAC.1
MILSELRRKLRATEDVGPRKVGDSIEDECLRAGERDRREGRRDPVTVKFRAIAPVYAERVSVEREFAVRVARGAGCSDR